MEELEELEETVMVNDKRSLSMFSSVFSTGVAGALSWMIAGAAYLVLLLRGLHSTHQGYIGDDVQLYRGVHQLWFHGSFYPSAINAYPPAAAWVYFPFALFSWPTAHTLWFLFSTAICLLALGIVLYRWFGSDLPPSGLPLWLTTLFLSAPPYVIAYFGQIFWPMALALALAWQWAYAKNFRLQWASGLLYAIALTKPTISLPFLVYQCIRKPTRAPAIYGVFLTLVLTLATAAFYHHPVQVVQEYRATIHALVVPGSYNDTGFRNPRRGFLFNAGILFFDGIRWINRGQQGPETVLETNIERILEMVFALFAGGVVVWQALQANALEKLEKGVTTANSGAASAWRNADDWAFAWLTLIAMLLFYHAWTDFGMLCLPLIVVLNALAGKRTRCLMDLKTLNLKIITFIMIFTLFLLARNREVFAWQTHLTRILLMTLFFQLLYENFKFMRSSKRLFPDKVEKA